MSHKEIISKDNLEKYLMELAKQYKKISGRKMPAEIVIIGGASILINYGFRYATEDIDAMIASSSAMKDAIYKTAEKLGLPDDWINTDFKFTTSFSNNIPLYSKHYKTFCNIVDVRTISAEYLLAMKLKAARPYKHDMSDIVGILLEEYNRGNLITKEMIEIASKNLYGKYECDKKINEWLNKLLESKNFKEEYEKYKDEEKEISKAITQFRNENPDFKVNHENVRDLAEKLKKKMNK